MSQSNTPHKYEITYTDKNTITHIFTAKTYDECVLILRDKHGYISSRDMLQKYFLKSYPCKDNLLIRENPLYTEYKINKPLNSIKPPRVTPGSTIESRRLERLAQKEQEQKRITEKREEARKTLERLYIEKQELKAKRALERALIHEATKKAKAEASKIEKAAPKPQQKPELPPTDEELKLIKEIEESKELKQQTKENKLIIKENTKKEKQERALNKIMERQIVIENQKLKAVEILQKIDEKRIKQEQREKIRHEKFLALQAKKEEIKQRRLLKEAQRNALVVVPN